LFYENKQRDLYEQKEKNRALEEDIKKLQQVLSETLRNYQRSNVPEQPKPKDEDDEDDSFIVLV
jgi:hypothetical protein